MQVGEPCVAVHRSTWSLPPTPPHTPTQVFLAAFTLEMVLKVAALGPVVYARDPVRCEAPPCLHACAFPLLGCSGVPAHPAAPAPVLCRGQWSAVDVLVVVVGFLGYASGVSNVSGLRALRILRPLKAVSSVRGLRVRGWADAVPPPPPASTDGPTYNDSAGLGCVLVWVPMRGCAWADARAGCACRWLWSHCWSLHGS